jgi:prophage maintenance system killer protein
LDGNKRTGLAAATVFLQANGYDLSIEFSDHEIYDFVIKVASAKAV